MGRPLTVFDQPIDPMEVMNVNRSLRTIGAGVLAGALLFSVAACSSDDDKADDTTTTTVAEDTTTTLPDELNIVETAVSAGSFTVLATLLQEADLVGTLSGDGPFTVFAPTDEAFAAAAADLEVELDDLAAALTAEENKELLAEILSYHVVAGEVLAATVVTLDGQEVDTVAGIPFTVNVDGETVTITDGAGRTVGVVDVDVLASNGVIHILDNVLLPSIPELG